MATDCGNRANPIETKVIVLSAISAAFGARISFKFVEISRARLQSAHQPHQQIQFPPLRNPRIDPPIQRIRNSNANEMMSMLIRFGCRPITQLQWCGELLIERVKSVANCETIGF